MCAAGIWEVGGGDGDGDASASGLLSGIRAYKAADCSVFGVLFVKSDPQLYGRRLGYTQQSASGCLPCTCPVGAAFGTGLGRPLRAATARLTVWHCCPF